jgi:DNA invertase Pin-like site-specific DNA recombinase
MTKRVAIYVRVSTFTQTVENQERELRAIAVRAGWKITKIYSDVGISGARRKNDRPGFKALCDDAARRRFDMVAAWSVDRLGRSLQDLVVFLSNLNSLGVDLYLYRQAIDTSSPAGRALFQLLSVFAEFERSLIKERVVAGLDRARSQGRILGRPRIDAHVEAQIRELLSKKDRGIRRIARDLGIGTGTVQRIKASLAITE